MDIQIHACRRSRPALAFVLGVAASTVLAAPSGTFALQRAVIAAGGATRLQSACFTVSATAGEPAAGAMHGSSVTLVSGFWAAPVAHTDELFRSSFERCTA